MKMVTLLNCEDAHPISEVQCRLKGNHPTHMGGYGIIEEWPNENWVAPQNLKPLEVKQKMLNVVNRIRQSKR
jgi:hypothetical protein